jgi:RNA polymerase sigma-70 factor, ECF subfamily
LTTANERALVMQAREGDRDAFAQLFRAHQLRVYNLVRYAAADATEAEDITQAAFVRAWEELPRLRDPQAFTAWLNRIARNVATDRARALGARGREETSSAEPTGPNPAEPEGSLVRQEHSEVVHKAIASLSEPHQEVVLMHHLQDLPVQEVAERLDVPVGTVLSRLARARAALRRKLAPYVEADAS